MTIKHLLSVFEEMLSELRTYVIKSNLVQDGQLVEKEFHRFCDDEGLDIETRDKFALWIDEFVVRPMAYNDD